MSAVAKSGTPSMCTPVPCDANKLPPLPVGEDIAAGDPCSIHSDGKIYRTDGETGAAGTTAEVDGWAAMPAKAAQRQTLSLLHDVNFNYGTGLTPGTFLYVGDNGALQTTAATVQTKPVARVIDATRIRVFRSY